MKNHNFGDSRSTITPLHDPLASPAPDAKNEVRNTTCYMCACRCGIRVHLRDGEVRYIDGNPDHPLNNGVICAKGSSGIMKQYSPARLTKPLRRKPGVPTRCLHAPHRLSRNFTVQATPVPVFLIQRRIQRIFLGKGEGLQ